MLSTVFRTTARRLPAAASFSLFSTSTLASSSNPSAHQKLVMAVKDNVENTIANTKIVIYSKSYCPFCKKAKNLIASEYPDVQTEILELDETDEGSEIQAYLQQKTGQRTVPNIFINQKHVGGCDDLFSLNKKGGLSALVNA